jgi:glycosyltransferase involved in cell wall biosynthesis
VGKSYSIEKNDKKFNPAKKKMNPNKKKILFILPTLSKGGQERVASRLSFALPDSFEKFLVVFYKDRVDYPFNGKIIFINLPLFEGWIKIPTKIFLLSTKILALRKIKKEIKPDFSLSFGPEANAMNVLSNFGLKTKTILSIHIVEGTYFKNYPFLFKWFHKLVMRFVYKLADKIVTVSQGVAQDLIENFSVKKEKITVIYNFQDLEEINRASLEDLGEFRNLFLKNKVVISVGRLTPQKGFRYLIEGFKKVVEKHPETILVILGEGELKEELEKLIEKLNLKEKVFLLGFQKNPFKFLKNSSIFVLPSLWEGFGNVLIEAMACGIPVISSDCKSGPREIISPHVPLNEKIDKLFFGEYGILIPPKNSEEISKAIFLLLENENLRKEYSKKSLERAKDFSVEKIVPKWLEILK